MAAELQAVLAQACAALEAQEQGRLQEAAQVGLWVLWPCQGCRWTAQ